MALAAKRSTTRAVYDGHWAAYTAWCAEWGYNPFSTSVVEVLCILQAKASSVSLIIILGYVTAISERHAKVRVGSKAFPLLKHLAACTRGSRSSDVPPLSLELVLFALRKAPFEPLEQATFKELTLKTVF